MTNHDRITFISQFLDPRWSIIGIVGITDEILVVVTRDTIAPYPHRRNKK